VGSMGDDIEAEQRQICAKYNVPFAPILANQRVGISRNLTTGEMPIYGIRHPAWADMAGWFLWAGEKTDDPDFFLSLHAEHLPEWCPLAVKYLGLPPGWAFVTDLEGYEDVWFDPEYLIE
jgi:hypothetical protein